MMRDVVALEVGDEIYAFEKYTPSPRDNVEGIWYRGCVQIHLRVKEYVNISPGTF